MRESTPAVQISLAGCLTWGIRACDEPSGSVLRALAKTVRLTRLAGTPDRVLLVCDPLLGPAPDGPSGGVVYDLGQVLDAGTATEMARICALLAAHTPGAALLHGALVARDGRGVVLTGPGGYGKTTTARRLPPPWQVLSDDATLVVRDPSGRYVAHPWPTWSRLILDHSEERWDVEQWLPLDHILCLGRSDRDAIEPLGQGTALCLLLESMEQLRSYLPAELVCAAQRLKDLETASRLVKSVPVSILRFSRTGPVWLAIEQTLSSSRRQP